jgi:hypothetical protein
MRCSLGRADQGGVVDTTSSFGVIPAIERRFVLVFTIHRLLTCLDAPSTWASRAVGCEVGGRLAPKLLANLLGVALS